MPSPITNAVFVYGTLKSKNKIRGLDQFPGAEFVSAAITTDRIYTMYDMGAFPAVTEHGDRNIVGEVWNVDGDTFDQLDAIEGYPTFYTRKEVHTSAGEAWMYYIKDISQHDWATEMELTTIGLYEWQD